MRLKYLLLTVFIIGKLYSMDAPEGQGSSNGTAIVLKDDLKNHRRRSSLSNIAASAANLFRSPRRINSPRKKKDKDSFGTPRKNGKKAKDKEKAKDKKIEQIRKVSKKKKRPDSTEERGLITKFGQLESPELFRLLQNNPQLRKTWESKLHNLKHSKEEEEQQSYGKLLDEAKKSSSSSSGSSSHSSSSEGN